MQEADMQEHAGEQAPVFPGQGQGGHVSAPIDQERGFAQAFERARVQKPRHAVHGDIAGDQQKRDLAGEYSFEQGPALG
ncbi:hypothetical protein ACM1PE_07305 [Achromobacter sp. PD1]|uniref:hypothetical protein n=1 Tax=Achromobacter sp. PD1 TaxID=3399125 RepID=UPI003AF8F685